MTQTKNIKKITDGWEREFTDEYRNRKSFSFFYLTICDNIFTINSKFFGIIKTKQQKIFDRFEYFDDGWTYQNYWGKWKQKWICVELLNEK